MTLIARFGEELFSNPHYYPKLIEQGFAKDEDEAFFIVQGWEGRSKYDDVYDAVKNGNSMGNPALLRVTIS